MDKQLKDKAAKRVPQADAEVLKAVESRQTTMTASYLMSLSSETVHEALKILYAKQRGISSKDVSANKGLNDSLATISFILTTKPQYASIFLTGEGGSGKTEIFNAIFELFKIAKELDADNGCQIFAYSDLEEAVLFYNLQFFRYEENPTRLLYNLTEAAVLLLDNFGMEDGTPEENNNIDRFIHDVLMIRRDLGVPTILASQFDIESLRDWYGPAVADLIESRYTTIEL